MSVVSRERGVLEAATQVLSHASGHVPACIAAHTIRWTVSARALGAVCPELIDTAPEREDATLELLIEIDAERFRACVSVRHQSRQTRLADIGGVVEHAMIGGCALVHLDSDELVATLRAQDGGLETLYARLPLLARMGIAGGRYELKGG